MILRRSFLNLCNDPNTGLLTMLIKSGNLTKSGNNSSFDQSDPKTRALPFCRMCCIVCYNNSEKQFSRKFMTPLNRTKPFSKQLYYESPLRNKDCGLYCPVQWRSVLGRCKLVTECRISCEKKWTTSNESVSLARSTASPECRSAFWVRSVLSTDSLQHFLTEF
jgi:hypothetical protein